MATREIRPAFEAEELKRGSWGVGREPPALLPISYEVWGSAVSSCSGVPGIGLGPTADALRTHLSRGFMCNSCMQLFYKLGGASCCQSTRDVIV